MIHLPLLLLVTSHLSILTSHLTCQALFGVVEPRGGRVAPSPSLGGPRVWGVPSLGAPRGATTRWWGPMAGPSMGWAVESSLRRTLPEKWFDKWKQVFD